MGLGQRSEGSALCLRGGQLMEIDRHSALTEAFDVSAPIGWPGRRHADRPKAGQFRYSIDVEAFMILRSCRGSRGEWAIRGDAGTGVNGHRARDGVRRSLGKDQFGERATLADPRQDGRLVVGIAYLAFELLA